MNLAGFVKGFGTKAANFGKALGVETAVQYMAESLRKAFGGVAEDAVKNGIEQAIRKLVSLMEEKRSELFAYIDLTLRAVDSVAADNLLRYHRERLDWQNSNGKYGRFAENKIVLLLTKFYLALDTDEEERQRRLETFKSLGRMTQDEFDGALEFLYHDVVRNVFGAIGDFFAMVFEWISNPANGVASGLIQWSANLPGAKTGRPDFCFWRR